MPGPRVSVAMEHYDRHLPLLGGVVQGEGFELEAVHVSTEGGRHERMLHERPWDAAELSLSSYLMAKARDAELTAVPVFPRRLFSQSQMYINVNCGIETPNDLIGKRVGLRSYQTTLSVLAKGDLGHEYGVPLDQVIWVTSSDEPVPFDAPPGVRIERADKSIETMLVEGEVQAYMTPRMPRAFVNGAPQVARLFGDARAEEEAYYQRNGFYPIMHVLAVKPEVVAETPEVATGLIKAFEQAKEICYDYYSDPNWSHLAWAAHQQVQERSIMGPDPWPNGVARNRANLERFIQYELDQGLIDRRLEVDELFVEATLGS